MVRTSRQCKQMYGDRKQVSGAWRWSRARKVGQGEAGGRGHKGAPGYFRGIGYVYYLDCGDGFMGIYRCQNLPDCVLNPVQFVVGQLYQ